LLFELVLLVMCAYMNKKAEKYTEFCEVPVRMWMWVQTVLYGMNAIKNIMIIVMVSTVKDPLPGKKLIDIFYAVVVSNF